MNRGTLYMDNHILVRQIHFNTKNYDQNSLDSLEIDKTTVTDSRSLKQRFHTLPVNSGGHTSDFVKKTFT